MRYALLLFILLPTFLYGLPCPNGQGVLYKGDSIQEVIRQCGEPLRQQTNTREINAFKKWVYYRPHYYEQGFSQINIFFNNERVSNIQINEYYPWLICQRFAVQIGLNTTIQTSCGNTSFNPSYTGVCGVVFGIGATSKFIHASCGEPAERTDMGTSVTTTELIYGVSSPQTIIFENDRLIDWK